MFTKEDKFRDYLKSKGLKYTPERRLVLREIFSFHNHFDAEGLFEKLREKGEHVSRATIYRTLPLLIESGLIKEALRCQDHTHYEHVFGHPHHDHLVCLGCGRVIEFREDKIERMQELICRRYDFQSIEHRLGIRGYCNRCKKKFLKYG